MSNIGRFFSSRSFDFEINATEVNDEVNCLMKGIGINTNNLVGSLRIQGALTITLNGNAGCARGQIACSGNNLWVDSTNASTATHLFKAANAERIEFSVVGSSTSDAKCEIVIDGTKMSTTTGSKTTSMNVAALWLGCLEYLCTSPGVGEITESGLSDEPEASNQSSQDADADFVEDDESSDDLGTGQAPIFDAEQWLSVPVTSKARNFLTQLNPTILNMITPIGLRDALLNNVPAQISVKSNKVRVLYLNEDEEEVITMNDHLFYPTIVSATLAEDSTFMSYTDTTNTTSSISIQASCARILGVVYLISASILELTWVLGGSGGDDDDAPTPYAPLLVTDRTKQVTQIGFCAAILLALGVLAMTRPWSKKSTFNTNHGGFDGNNT